MELSRSELEQLEVDELFKQLATFNCNCGWLLYDISKTKYRFNKQNYLNIAYGLNQSTIARYKSSADYADIMDKKIYNTCNVYNNISFRASYTNAKLELFVEHGTYVNYLEAKQFCSELKRLLPDINIFNTINRIIQE